MSVLIKGGRVITAADDYVGDVLVENERISLIGESLDVDADRVIDASGQATCSRAQSTRTRTSTCRSAARRRSTTSSRGRRAAAFGGTTCHVDFCIQAPGTRFADALDDWKSKAEGKQVIDMGYHIAVTDLKDGGSLEELATLPDQGITSYKLFMAYKGALMVDDETLFSTMEVAAETGALVMVHAENGDAIDVLVKQALAAGHTEPKYHALTRPPETEGEATNRAIQLARVAGCAALRRPRFLQGVGRADRAGARGGLERLGRDVHAVLLRRLHVPRAAELRGREVRLHAAAARQGEPGRALGRRPPRHRSARSRPTTARSSGTARSRSARTTSRRSRTAAPASRTGCT